MKKEQLRNSKGITLIALIITIIILLILAVVSVKLVINNGIITQAQDATKKYSEEQEKERVNLVSVTAKLANNGGEIIKINLEEALKKEFGENNYTLAGETAPFEVTITNGTGKTYVIESTGTVRIKESNENISGPVLDELDFTYKDNGDNTITITGINVDGTKITTQEETIESNVLGQTWSVKLKTIYMNGEKVTTLKIPSSINGKEVTDIGTTKLVYNWANEAHNVSYENECLNGYNIETLIIPGTIKVVGGTAESNISNTFAYNNSIKHVILEEGVVKIGASAFNICGNLTSVKLPSTLNIIDMMAFSQCVNLANVEIPNGVTTIGMQAFLACEKLSKLRIPDKVTVFNDQINGLQELNVPEGINISGNINDMTYKDKLTIKVRGTFLKNGNEEINATNVGTKITDPNVTVEWNSK